MNWSRSCAEQRIQRMDHQETELLKNLSDLQQTFDVGNVLQLHRETMYLYEIEL